MTVDVIWFWLPAIVEWITFVLGWNKKEVHTLKLRNKFRILSRRNIKRVQYIFYVEYWQNKVMSISTVIPNFIIARFKYILLLRTFHNKSYFCAIYAQNNNRRILVQISKQPELFQFESNKVYMTIKWFRYATAKKITTIL